MRHAAWAAIGFAVFCLTGGGVVGTVAAAVAVAAAIAAWALWASPKSSAPALASSATKLAVFGGSVALLAAAGRTWLAIGLAALIVIAHAGAWWTGHAQR